MTSTRDPLPFDRAHLSTFTGGDMALERDLLEDFAINARAHLAALHAALGNAQWNECAHRLKGASSGIGMRTLAHLCGEAEALAFERTEAAAQMLSDMQAQLDRLDRYLAL